MREEIVEFVASDGALLEGVLRSKEKNNQEVLIQVHGMTADCLGRRNAIIAKEVAKLGIDSFSINTRGSDVVRLVKFADGTKKLGGTAFEDISDSYFDICGAIEFALSRGYTKVYLQGHSLGATKVVYAYNRMLKDNKSLAKHVKAVVLMSLVDVVHFVKHMAKGYVPYAEAALKKGHDTYLFYKEEFISPMSPATFLRYAKHGKDINFAQFGKEHDDFEVLNGFKVPLFFRWGNVNELALMDVEAQVEFVKKKIQNKHLDAGYIDGANHSYVGKEKELAHEIAKFLAQVQK